MAANGTNPWIMCQHVDTFRALLLTTVLTCLIVITVGIVGNILTFFTLQVKCLKSVNNFFLKILAAWDALFLVGAFITICMELPLINNAEEWEQAAKASQADSVITIVTLSLQLGSTWHLVLFGLYRFLSVFKPFWTEKYCTIQNTLKVIVAIAILSIGLHIPLYTFISDNKPLHLISYLYDLPQYNNDNHGRYMLFLILCMYLFFPIGLLVIFNIEIQKSRQKSKPIFKRMKGNILNNGTDYQLRQITKTFVAISLTFILTSSTVLITFVVTWVSKISFPENPSMEMIQDSKQCFAMLGYIFLFTFLPLMNASVKVLIYLQMKPFRKGVKKLVCCFKKATKHVRFSDHDNKAYNYEQ